MAIALPNLVYVSGDHSAPQPVGLPEFQAPFEHSNVDYLLKQDFQCALNDFAPLALNTPHPDFPEFVLVAESEPKKDVTGGMVKWTRTYAKVPTTFTEPGGNLNYTIIGFAGGASGEIGDLTIAVGREPRPKNQECQLTHEFFLVGPDEDYETWEAIPVTPAQTYVLDYHALDPGYDNVNFPTTLLRDTPPFGIASVPTRADYETWIAADKADVTSFSIVAEDSTLSRWQGNIYRRTTRRVKAF